jgi:transcriptional regulator with XRE-family HTH domain
MGKSIDNDLLWKIAEAVKALREERGITQEVFYHDTGIHVGRIERAQRNISVTTLAQICKYLGVSLEEFCHRLGQ